MVAEGLGVGKTSVVDGNESVSKGGLVCGRKVTEEFFGKCVMRVGVKGVDDGLEGGICSVA